MTSLNLPYFRVKDIAGVEDEEEEEEEVEEEEGEEETCPSSSGLTIKGSCSSD